MLHRGRNAVTQYERARSEYADLGVDVESVLDALAEIPVSIHCWQGDDVGGFERPDSVLAGGGIQATGNFPGKARNVEELRADLDKVFSLVPGTHRLNLHASYGEFGDAFVDRDQIEEKHYQGWVDWAKERGIGLDFNGTFFSHPYADDGFTLASKDPKIRAFWIEHAKRCRRIAAWIGKELGSPCILDTWIPDGAKDYTVDKMGYRRILKRSLDEIFSIEYPKEYMRDALETKLFGIGSEAFVVGSHEFYMNYAARNGQMLCIDMGHFHVGEDISDKLSAILLFDDEILLHVSRPMRWDSDHVVLFNDTVRAVAEELVRSGKLSSAHIGLDYFDASINRVGAWVTGIRSMRKALLYAMLEPLDKLRTLEEQGNGYAKMALLETMPVMPFGAVWEEFCRREDVPVEQEVVDIVLDYEADVQGLRV
jgi:L-rhamnose isomerase